MSVPRLLLVFLVALGVALAAATPVEVLLSTSGAADRLTARETHGTVWKGRLENAALGGADLGRLDLSLHAASLLRGRPALDFAAQGDAFAGRGRLIAGDGIAVEALDGRAPLSALGVTSSVSGSVALRDVAVVFGEGRCQSASGRISADVRIQGDRPVALSGRAACQGDDLVLTLTGAMDDAPVEIVTRLGMSGRYRTAVRVTTTDPTLGALLSADGFAGDGAGFSKTSEGRFT